MGKGDIRTRRGKLFRGTYGKTRPKKKKKIFKQLSSVKELDAITQGKMQNANKKMQNKSNLSE